MKHLLVALILTALLSCQNENQQFEPIAAPEELTDTQIDSILTKFDFKYENAILIDSTDQMLIPLTTNQIQEGRKKKFSSQGYSSNSFPRFWNIIFYNKRTGVTKVLTKDKTRISRIHANRSKMENNTMKNKILYELTQTDYNQDGRLNSMDPEFLYASDLNGNKLVRVSPDNEDLKHFDVMPDANQIILRTLRDTNQDSIFNRDDESILYKAELTENKWELTEIIVTELRKEIETLYIQQWLTKSE